MSIDKSPIRVQGASAVEPNSGLPMYRLFTKFEGNREYEFIKVFYNEWLESGTAKLNYVTKSYFVKDIEGYPAFTGWHDYPLTAEMAGLRLGGDLIIGQINQTLTNLAFDVEDEHITHP